jgi:GTP cyclohydrolase II
MKHIVEQGQGIVIYLPQEGRGIGLANKIAVYAQQEKVIHLILMTI